MSSRPKIRKTKIVATIGPASDSPAVIRDMIRAGMNVARLNLSHGTLEEHKERLGRIRSVAADLDANTAIMIDTRGIEIRTGQLRKEWVDLNPGAAFNLYTDGRMGDQDGVSVSYLKLAEEVRAGMAILLDDGAIELKVEASDGENIRCQVVLGGRLGVSKSVNLPGTELSLSAVSPENREDVMRELAFAANNDIDYIAASFIQNANDLVKMREILSDHGVVIPIIAKIENRAGVEHLEEIVAAADGVMVARGDLGVELPLADVPGTQKKIIRSTVTNRKPVITATQMLASMERNPKPTRAEASDVANAILDGSSALMLSGETAAGRYPVEAVRVMHSLALRAEESLQEYGFLQRVPPQRSSGVTEAVSQAATEMAADLKAAAIFSLTETGFTSRQLSKHRPECPILAITASRPVVRRLSLNWGVVAILYSGERSDEDKIEFGLARARELGYVQDGDILVATAGYHQHAGGTDLIRVITVGASASRQSRGERDQG